MNYIDLNNLSDLDLYWLRKFKASKTLDTLHIQVNGAERKVEQGIIMPIKEKFDNKTSINIAFCLRESEIKTLTGDWS